MKDVSKEETFYAEAWQRGYCLGCETRRNMPKGASYCPRCQEAPFRISRYLPGLRRVRLARGLTPRALADISGVNIQVIHRAENGFGKTRPTSARKLASALRVDAWELLQESEICACCGQEVIDLEGIETDPEAHFAVPGGPS